MPVSTTADWYLKMVSRLSSDSDGVAECLGLQSEARVDLAEIIAALESKISNATLFAPI